MRPMLRLQRCMPAAESARKCGDGAWQTTRNAVMAVGTHVPAARGAAARPPPPALLFNLFAALLSRPLLFMFSPNLGC
jgi:hypothetical protein